MTKFTFQEFLGGAQNFHENWRSVENTEHALRENYGPIAEKIERKFSPHDGKTPTSHGNATSV